MCRLLAIVPLLVMLGLPPGAQARSVESVVIDPGHGGYDFGIRGEGLREKDIALALARKLKEFLAGQGLSVRLTRAVDQHLTIKDRRGLIDGHGPDLLLSIHLSDSDSAMLYVNWYKKTEADLTLREYYSLASRQRRYIYESRLLQGIIAESLGKEFDINVYQGELPLPLLGETGAPAVHVELPSKGIRYDTETLQRMAYALGIGIQIYGQSE